MEILGRLLGSAQSCLISKKIKLIGETKKIRMEAIKKHSFFFNQVDISQQTLENVLGQKIKMEPKRH